MTGPDSSNGPPRARIGGPVPARLPVGQPPRVPGARPAQSHARSRSTRRRRTDRLSILLLGVAALVTVIVVAVSGGTGGSRGPGSAGGTKGRSGARPGVHGTSSSADRIVSPGVRSSLTSSITFPGKPVTIPMPSGGQGAVGVDGIGIIAQSAKEHPVPIASVTKVMTAVVVLRDHPLTGNEGGPTFTMTAADHAAWIYASENDHSNVEIVAGEKIDERQLLEALLIPSADNVADYLARWDAGSIPAFVAKMNAEAHRLGLTSTHYADASGVDPQSASTAHDQVILGGYAMRDPVIRSIVMNSSVVLPTAGRVWNFNPVIGVDGIVGLKSGFTQAASGCLVTAAWRKVGAQQVLVVSAALGQTLGLGQAGQADVAMLDAASSELSARTVVPAGSSVGRATAGWDHSTASLQLPAGSSGITAVGWPGLVLTTSLQPVTPTLSRVEHGWPAGSAVAMLTFSSTTTTVSSEPVVLGGRLPPPPPGWSPGGS